MIPTSYLRLVRRKQFITMGDFSHAQQEVEVLQQWWSGKGEAPSEAVEYENGRFACYGEWRDVELVEE